MVSESAPAKPPTDPAPVTAPVACESVMTIVGFGAADNEPTPKQTSPAMPIRPPPAAEPLLTAPAALARVTFVWHAKPIRPPAQPPPAATAPIAVVSVSVDPTVLAATPPAFIPATVTATSVEIVVSVES